MAGSGAADALSPSFEAHLEALEKVVLDLEGDALSLESSIDRYQQGVSHLASCRRILAAAEQRLLELMRTADGTLVEKPLAVGPEGLVDAGPATPAKAPSEKAGGRSPRKASSPPPPSFPSPSGTSGDDLPF